MRPGRCPGFAGAQQAAPCLRLEKGEDIVLPGAGSRLDEGNPPLRAKRGDLAIRHLHAPGHKAAGALSAPLSLAHRRT